MNKWIIMLKISERISPTARIRWKNRDASDHAVIIIKGIIDNELILSGSLTKVL